MVDEQMPRVDAEPEMDPTSGLRTFNEWLQVQLKARKLSQRQLAQRSGVDHSTISRLMRGHRIPSLRTATLLADGLGGPQYQRRLDDEYFGRSGSSMARVEHALRSDDQLHEADVREIMAFYLEARLHRPGRVATPAPSETRSRAPVPIIIEVPGLRPGSASTERLRRLPAPAPGEKPTRPRHELNG
jgi:transcriptional regulator with XRE-family HTH domain